MSQATADVGAVPAGRFADASDAVDAGNTPSPPNVFTPVEVLKVPVLPLKSFDTAPEAINPAVNVGRPVTEIVPLPRVTAPVEVLNVPVEPEKSFAAEPEAVKPVAITGDVSVVFEIVC